MNQKRKLLWGIAALVILLLAAYILYNGLSQRMAPEELQSKGEEELQSAPDFTVFDPDGNQVKRSDFLGKPLVINFWATWCPFCVEELPEFDEVYADLKDEVAFLMVDVADGQRETVEKAAAFVAENGYQFPVAYDTELDAVTQFGIRAFPTTVLVDSDGTVVFTKEGKISKKQLLKAISQIEQ